MEYNFRIYYSKESGLPCVEYKKEEIIVLMKADVLECNVSTFGVYRLDKAGGKYWSMAGMASSIIQENNKITIL
jgi:hypothetical protein